MEAFADVALLSRLQFALTVAYHFLFVPLSIGLGLILAINETRYYRTRKPEDAAATKFWVKIFTATFAIGVATGITMEFLRYELGELLARRGRHLRGALGRRGSAGLLLGVRLLGGAAVRPQARVAEVLYGVRLARVGGILPVGPVDPHRELLDADAGRR